MGGFRAKDAGHHEKGRRDGDAITMAEGISLGEEAFGKLRPGAFHRIGGQTQVIL